MHDLQSMGHARPLTLCTHHFALQSQLLDSGALGTLQSPAGESSGRVTDEHVHHFVLQTHLLAGTGTSQLQGLATTSADSCELLQHIRPSTHVHTWAFSLALVSVPESAAMGGSEMLLSLIPSLHLPIATSCAVRAKENQIKYPDMNEVFHSRRR
jgi:hypothetical protein